MNERIILASASPRRAELMRRAGIPFTVLPTETDETLDAPLPPGEAALVISQRKAVRAAEMVDTPAIIIAADTVVYADGLLLGKPADAADAYGMLNRLQGRWHTVVTGVTLVKRGEAGPDMCSFTETAQVYMRALTADEIHAYIATGEVFDKAGAYGVQEKGSVLIERINGDYYTVMGLPMAALYKALRDMGIAVAQFWKNADTRSDVP